MLQRVAGHQDPAVTAGCLHPDTRRTGLDEMQSRNPDALGARPASGARAADAPDRYLLRLSRGRCSRPEPHRENPQKSLFGILAQA
jgi:hypothetical protein